MSNSIKRYVMVIDTKKCVGCAACVIACKTENYVPEGLHRDWIVQEVKGRYPNLHLEIRSERCNHCSRPPCVYGCPTGATFVDDNCGEYSSNVVLMNSKKCVGCKSCISVCPYDARYVQKNEEIGWGSYIGKCTFCDHRYKKGLLPACVEVCATSCIYFGDLNDPKSEVSKILNSRNWKTLRSEAGTTPNLFFLI